MSIARLAAWRGLLRGIAVLLFPAGAGKAWAAPDSLRFGLRPYHSPRFLANCYADLNVLGEISEGELRSLDEFAAQAGLLTGIGTARPPLQE